MTPEDLKWQLEEKNGHICSISGETLSRDTAAFCYPDELDLVEFSIKEFVGPLPIFKNKLWPKLQLMHIRYTLPKEEPKDDFNNFEIDSE